MGDVHGNWRCSVYYRYDGHHAARGVPAHGADITDRYRLIRLCESDEWKLLDLERDSKETQSICGLEGIDGVTAELRTELIQLRKMFVVAEP